MPLKKYADSDKLTVCSGCQFYETNTEFIDLQLAEIFEKNEFFTKLSLDKIIDSIFEAFRLFSLQNANITFMYRDLSAVQLVCLQILSGARNEAEINHMN